MVLINFLPLFMYKNLKYDILVFWGFPFFYLLILEETFVLTDLIWNVSQKSLFIHKERKGIKVFVTLLFYILTTLNISMLFDKLPTFWLLLYPKPSLSDLPLHYPQWHDHICASMKWIEENNRRDFPVVETIWKDPVGWKESDGWCPRVRL